jgi:uncharacterized protein YyaL (SSP411 family)
MSFKQSIIDRLWKLFPVDIEAKKELDRERNNRISDLTNVIHLKETAAWLCRAQDSTSDDGVSRSYKAAVHKGYGPHGWQPSYPETTGYIIPTMMALSKVFTDASYLDRAVKMADWEREIQMKSGAVMGSVVTAPPSPAVFNTGQVIFGWLAAFNETRQDKYLDAALRAGNYLLSVQEMNGSFSRGDSNFALKGATTYNARVAWALIELGLSTKNEKYINSGRKNIDHALLKQNGNGWFMDNCLNDPEKPLLHTIVYTTRGVLESGIALNEERYIQSAIKTLDELIGCQRPDGGIPGRLDAGWSSAARWDCVTGDAQAAISWLRAHAITGNSKYKDSARKAIDFVKRTQNLEHPNSGIRGGVKGSFPFDGPYGQFEMLNWAAKFFCDALMMIEDENLAAKGIKG